MGFVFLFKKVINFLLLKTLKQFNRAASVFEFLSLNINLIQRFIFFTRFCLFACVLYGGGHESVAEEVSIQMYMIGGIF